MPRSRSDDPETRDTASPSHAPEPAPFSRPTPVARLKASSTLTVDDAATEAERTAVARLLDLRSLDDLALTGRLAPHGRGGWRFEGRLTARYAQTCGVTLEPAPGALDASLERIWLPEGELRGRDLELIDPELEEEPEPLPEVLDLAAAAVEELALSLDPYPRAPDAELEADSATPPGVDPIDETPAERPFAALAALKAKMERDEGD